MLTILNRGLTARASHPAQSHTARSSQTAPNKIDVGENDNSQDLIYIFADVATNDRPNDGSFMDLIENIESNDRIYILGNEATDNLGFVDNGSFVDIYHNDAIEARLLNTELTASQVEGMTSFF